MSNWYVIRLQPSGYIMFQADTPPDTTQRLVLPTIAGALPITVAANRYQVVYVADSELEAIEYMNDVVQ